jgi:hypothetical protein
MMLVALSDAARSQGQTASVANYTLDFDLGTASWLRYGSSVRLATQATAPKQSTYFNLPYRSWNAMVIKGIGSVEQWVPVDGRTTKWNIASVEGMLFFDPSSERLFDPSFGITYYDENFQEPRMVWRRLRYGCSAVPQVYPDASVQGDRIANLDPLKLNTIGGVVPENARWAKMWIRNDGGRVSE